MLCLRLYAFVEAAALRSIILRYAGVPIDTRVSFVCLKMPFFPTIFFLSFPLSLCLESTSYVLSFPDGGVLLSCDHGLDF